MLSRRYFNPVIIHSSSTKGPADHDPNSPLSWILRELGEDLLNTSHLHHSFRGSHKYADISGFPFSGAHKGLGVADQSLKMGAVDTSFPIIGKDDFLLAYRPFPSFPCKSPSVAPFAQPEIRAQQFRRQNRVPSRDLQSLD